VSVRSIVRFGPAISMRSGPPSSRAAGGDVKALSGPKVRPLGSGNEAAKDSSMQAHAIYGGI
jgi:hypothetical protein